MTRPTEESKEFPPSNSILVDREPGIDEVQVHHLTNGKSYIVVLEECGVKERDDGTTVLELVIKEGEDSTKELLRDCLATLNHLCACPACAKLCERISVALGKE